MEKKSYDWFEQRRKTRGLELAHDQITKAFDTVNWLHKATKAFSDKMKWAYLCKLGGLFEAGPDAGTRSEAVVAEKTHEQSMRVVCVGTHRPGGLGETLLPDGFPTDCRTYGWRDFGGRKVFV